MRVLPLDIPPHVAERIRRLPPDVKRSVKQALRALAGDPHIGAPLVGELEGLWKYPARRFRIVYAVDRARGMVRIVAVGPCKGIYDQVADAMRRLPRRKRSVVAQ